MEKPEKLDRFMYGIIKEASRSSLIEVCEWYEIDENELNKIQTWFYEKLNIDWWRP